METGSTIAERRSRGRGSDRVQLRPSFGLRQAHESSADLPTVLMHPRRDVQHHAVGEAVVFFVFERLIGRNARLGLLHQQQPRRAVGPAGQARGS